MQSQPSGDNEVEVAGFIAKTYEILNNEEYHKIIHWSTNGTEFVIRDCPKLEQLVLPKYFRHNKINSFVRQLNMYGFHKIKHSSFKSTFMHPLFRRGCPTLLPLVVRKIKTNEAQGLDGDKFTPQTPTEPAVQQQKWMSTGQFLVSGKLLNCSLQSMSCNELTGMLSEHHQDDYLSIQDAIEDSNRDEFLDFQDPSCFFSSMFDISE